MYADGWPLMPLYHANNIQGVGTYEAAECGLFTTDDPRNQDVIRYQKAYVAKIATELNGFDNVIFDISDEPLLQGNPDGGITIMKDGPVVPWLHAMRDAFLAAVAKLPKKHVLGQTVQSLSPDLSLEPWCQWLPTEYVKAARQRAGEELRRPKADRRRRVRLLRRWSRQAVRRATMCGSKAGGSCLAAAPASST